MIPRGLPTNHGGFWKVKKVTTVTEFPVANHGDLTASGIRPGETKDDLSLVALSPYDSSTSSRPSSAGSVNSRSSQTFRGGNPLDRFALLAAADADNPEHVKEAQLESHNITYVVRDDLPHFINLTYLDLGNNNVHLEDLLLLPALKELHLPCNGITVIPRLPKNAFPSLQILDLSYNKITAASVGNLSAISSLQILDLTYNEISSLPGNFSQFPKLEVLCLENNKLKSDAIKSLATAPKLKELNLSQNLLDNFPPSTLHAADSPVFRSLQKLNLANNNFCNEDSLKSLQNIPSLTHVMIWGNPIRKKAAENGLQRVSFSQVAPQNPPPSISYDPKRFLLSNKADAALLMSQSQKQQAPKNVVEEKVEEEVEDGGDQVPEYDYEPLPPEEDRLYKPFFMTQVTDGMEENSKAPISAGGVFELLYKEDDSDLVGDDAEELPPRQGIQAAITALKLALERPSSYKPSTPSTTTRFAQLNESAKNRLREQRLAPTLSNTRSRESLMSASSGVSMGVSSSGSSHRIAGNRKKSASMSSIPQMKNSSSNSKLASSGSKTKVRFDASLTRTPAILESLQNARNHFLSPFPTASTMNIAIV